MKSSFAKKHDLCKWTKLELSGFSNTHCLPWFILFPILCRWNAPQPTQLYSSACLLENTHTHTLLTTYLIKNNCKSLVLIRIRSASRLHLYDENKYYRFYVIYDNFKCSITSYFFKYLFLWLYCTSVAICIFIYFITLYNMLMTILFYSIV